MLFSSFKSCELFLNPASLESRFPEPLSPEPPSPEPLPSKPPSPEPSSFNKLLLPCFDETTVVDNVNSPESPPEPSSIFKSVVLCSDKGSSGKCVAILSWISSSCLSSFSKLNSDSTLEGSNGIIGDKPSGFFQIFAPLDKPNIPSKLR